MTKLSRALSLSASALALALAAGTASAETIRWARVADALDATESGFALAAEMRKLLP